MNYSDKLVYKMQIINMEVKIHFNNILINKIRFKDLKVHINKTTVRLAVK
jgi:hypothetical protein